MIEMNLEDELINQLSKQMAHDIDTEILKTAMNWNCSMIEMKLKSCDVGMFKLPGLIIEFPEDFTEESKTKILEEIDTWAASEQGTGTRMTDTLWSFRKESQRDWFILRWSGYET